MVFLPSPRGRQRQQVVELIEMESGVVEKRTEKGKEPISTVDSEVNGSNTMDLNTRNDKNNTLRTSLAHESNTPEDEIYPARRDADEFSNRGSDSLSNISSVSEEEFFPKESCPELHPHITFAYTDFEAGLSVPSRHSRLNSNNSIEEIEDGSLSKQIDNTRRDAVMTLSEKREKKAELVRKESEREKTIGFYKMAKYSISMSFQRFKEAVSSVSYTMELWYSSLKLIEGNFGSGVASYFKFLRWLFLLNLVSLLICIAFLVVPQLLARFFVNAYEVPEVTKNGGTYLEKKFSDPPDLNGTMPPPLTASALIYRSNPYHENSKFSLTDLFTGEGFLTATTMYYGFYKTGTLELFDGYPYDLPNAYFVSMAICYVIILITVSVSMARSYRRTYIETRGTSENIGLALKVFSGWDFSIATTKTANLNKNRIYNVIMEALNEEQYRNRNSTCLSRFTNVIVQLALNIIFLFLMAGIALLMWYLLERHSTYIVDNSSGHKNSMTMAIITSLVMNVLPIGFSWIVKYEDYRNPRTALFVTLLRTFFLNIVVIGTICFFWLTHQTTECWETALGQEVYRLLITDFFISLLLMVFVETVRSYLQRKYWKEHGRPEFDIASNTLNLIYNQTLFMVGFYFSPLLSVVIVIKLFITFYIKKAGALYNCKPPQKSWRAEQTQTLFLILTFITLLGVFLMFGYIIFKIPPSKCGPFSGFSFMYVAILNKIFQLQTDNVFWQVIVYLVKPGVVGGVLIAMSIATYILRAKAQAHAIEAEIFKSMLTSETKDKAFLFKFIKRIEQMNQKGGQGSPPLSTSSSFHTPLSERRELKRASNERQSSFLLTPGKSALHFAAPRKFYSASPIASTSWSFGRGNPTQEQMDQPSTSSGTSGASCDYEP